MRIVLVGLQCVGSMVVESLDDCISGRLIDFGVLPERGSGGFTGFDIAIVETSDESFFDRRVVFVGVKRMFVCLEEGGQPDGSICSGILSLVVERVADMVEETAIVAREFDNGEHGIVAISLIDLLRRATDLDEGRNDDFD